MVDVGRKLGERIKKIRKTAKLTQGQFAEKVNLSVEFISRLERGIGQPSFKTLMTMADVLNVSIKDLLDFKGPVTFKDKKQETKQRKKYLEAISFELKGMEVRELTVVYNVIKGLATSDVSKESSN